MAQQARVELEYKNDKVDLRAYHQQADEGFRNAASSISSGAKKVQIKLNARLDQFIFACWSGKNWR